MQYTLKNKDKSKNHRLWLKDIMHNSLCIKGGGFISAPKR